MALSSGASVRRCASCRCCFVTSQGTRSRYWGGASALFTHGWLSDRILTQNRADAKQPADRMPTIDDPRLIRCADRDRLSAALVECRRNTLRTFAAYQESLRASALQIPYSEQVNPPLWELGHVGWFQEYWIGRNPQRARGISADPQALRAAAGVPDADSLYDSSRVEHASRWHLLLPDAAATRDYLARTLEQTLRIPALADDSTAGRGSLYFAWLALTHEDM